MLLLNSLAFCLLTQCIIAAVQGSATPSVAAVAAGGHHATKKRLANTDNTVGGMVQTMQSRAVDTKVQFEVYEGQARATIVGTIPIKLGFTYRFNESPKEFVLNATTGEIRTQVVLDRETLKTDRFDLVILSSQPTYPIEVRVLVLDINDNAPQFPESSISIAFSESAAPGTKLLLDAATDRDAGINGIVDDYKIVSGNIDDKFRLEVIRNNPLGDTSYLYLRTTGKLDREIIAVYRLNISTRDGGSPPNYGYLNVNVTILDVNDNPPVFTQNDYSISLNESAPVGTQILRVNAIDEDTADNGKIEYYLAETERKFNVDTITGDIYIAERLNCPEQNCVAGQWSNKKNCPKSCVFTIYARDRGSPQQNGRAYVTVNLLDTNDHEPQIKFSYFPSTATFATVDENAANGSVVAAVSVVDPDDGVNGDTIVSIRAGNELRHFCMESSGQSFDLIRVNDILDREHIGKYNLTIVASDKGTPPRTATSFLIIYVNDVNDHEPVFEKSEYSAVLSELAPIGSYIAGITATDADTGVNALIYYSIMSGNDQNWFGIDADTGLLTTKALLDREIRDTVELKISARDGGPNPKWAYTHIKIIILDENDQQPKFVQAISNVSIPEDTAEGTLITTMTALDYDQGTNGSVIYALHADTAARYPATFYVNLLNGRITLTKMLDRESISTYQIKTIAKDQGSPPLSSTATITVTIIDVNDHHPTFYPLWYLAYVNRKTAVPGSLIVRLSATDADENDTISYRIENGDRNVFYIDETTGCIYLKTAITNVENKIYNLTISATDQDGKKSTDKAIVEIIVGYENDVELFTEFENNEYVFQVSEDDGLKDDFVRREFGKIRLKRKQHSANVETAKFFIAAGDPKQLFEIDERSGSMRTANKIDRETQSVYSLSVMAKLNEMEFAKTKVNVTILDVNDNRPLFGTEKDEITVAENTAIGQEIFSVRAKDADLGANSRIVYSIVKTIGNDNNDKTDDQFRIAADTGVVYLNRPITATPNTSLTIEIKATDSGTPTSLWSKHTLVFTILDVNDHTPIFERDSYETSLPESIAVNERFISVVAHDEDFGLNSFLTYTIVDGNEKQKFGIFPDGYVYVRQKLDREDVDFYCLTVQAKDAGWPERSSTVALIIYVLDENDNKPEFTNSSFTFYIKENEPADTFVGQLTATDQDAGRNAELTYSLIGGQKQQTDFIIDSRNGFIRTIRTFDRERLVQTTGQNYVTLEAIVTDNGAPTRLQDKVKISIFVTDVNDNAPQFTRLPYRVSLSEGSPVGLQVLRVFTTDTDEGTNKDSFYQISGGNDEKKFAIDRISGQITVAKMLDREQTVRYQLTITAYNPGIPSSFNANATVVVEITDENDNAPIFTNADSRIAILENIPANTKLYRFWATDRDAGVNKEISYSIGSGNRKESFQIDPSSGVLYLRKRVDYEDVQQYVLNITAYDGGNPRLSTTFLFTVVVEDCNDNAPVFPSTAIVRQIRENIPVNTPIVTVTAEDPDSGANGKIAYSIVKQEPSLTSFGSNNWHFQINSKTGVIHTLRAIDRESVDTFKLTIRATDQATVETDRLYAEKMVTVIVEDVNDNAPKFVSMNAVLLTETTPHSVITNVLAKDPDSGSNGMVTYDLVGGDVDLFAIHRTVGTLTLKKNLSTESRPKYRIILKATDEAVQSERRSIEQQLIVLQPSKKYELVFQDETNGSVYENEPLGTNILTVKAHHPGNSRYEIEYYITNITGGLGERQERRIFDIDPKSGIVSTAEILDREAGSEWYEVQVYAIVANSLTPSLASIKVRIDVQDKNDSPPSFNEMPAELSVSEDIPIGHVVTTVKATDPDTPTRITYSLTGEDAEKFHLDPDTGVLSLVDLLDRETKSKHKLFIQASDGMQKTETCLIVSVTDTNDNAPVFSENVYSFDVAENEARGTKIGQISATDEDENVNGVVTYTVISDWANDVFSLNPQTGVFTLTAKLDYEEVQHYIFTVQAQDYGRSALSSTVTVYFNVIDLNDNQPVFDSATYSTELFENVTIGTFVLSVSAQDLDSGDNGRVEYALSDENKENDFAIDPKNGTIYTVRTLDRETIPYYNLIIVAKDKAKPPQSALSASVQVTITIKDVNDMWPEFVISNETWIAENTALNTVVTSIKAIDRDEGRNGYLEYSLSDTVSGPGTFTLGTADGLLRVNGKLDRETKANYTLKIKAKDRGEPSRQSEFVLLVKIVDENDNAPIFNPKQYSAFVAENATIGVTALQVFATDDDEGVNGRIRFSIVEGDENRDFIIGEDTGVLRVSKNLNYERVNKYFLTIKAEDCDGNTDMAIRSDTATVAVTVVDVNDNFPIFRHSPYYAYAMENSVPYPNGYILSVKAYDADSPPFNSQIRYFLKEGDLDLFRINATNGDIYLLKPLDREKQSEHVLSVVAMDSGTPPLTGSGTVRIFVQDVNDHSPRFERTDYVAFVPENLPSGSDVIHIQAVDDDTGLNAKLRYSLLGDRVERFQVNSETGLITTKERFDREDVSVYRLTLIAQDSSVIEPKASTVNVVVNILDENDNAPIFDQYQYIVYIPDRTQSGEFVFGIIATDADADDNSRIEYTIMGNDSDKFSLNSKTGVIKATKELKSDFGTDTYKLTVEASDNGQPRKKSYAQITIKLRPAHLFPVISTPTETTFVLAEKSPAGELVARLEASSPKTGAAGVIRFAIAGGNLGEAFRVDSSTGEVTVYDGELDYELLAQYELWIEAEDSDTIPLRSVVQLLINVTDINDNEPRFANITYYASVLEEEYPPQSVLKVKAIDRDSGINGKVGYRLIEDGNGTFNVNARSGEISTRVKLDREHTDAYRLIVEAYDNGKPSLRSTTMVHVSVTDKNDNPPKFTRLFSVNVTENAELGAFVIQITSSDQDIGENANATFSFAENTANKFAIDPVSGNVTVAGSLDREIEDEYLLKVVAVDGSWRAETPLTITVQDQNDNAPEFEKISYIFYFPESNRDGVFIGSIVAQDKDKQGANSLITYSLLHPSEYFFVDPSTAEIYAKKRLRYKRSTSDTSPENRYNFVVVATDNGKPPLSTECRVVVNVIDANTNPPRFERSAYYSPVPKDAAAGTKIVRLRATDDKDFGINAIVDYTKIEGDEDGLFVVGTSDGWITLARTLDNVEPLNEFTFSVRASDRGIPSKSDRATVTLVVCGENRFAPVFSAISYQVIVPENEPIGSTIMTVTAADQDKGPNGMIRYSINDTEQKFRVNATSGQVTILKQLDYDETNEYKLTVSARDLGFSSKTAMATLTVSLTDVNDNAPTFNATTFEASISEKQPASSFVTQILATDRDSSKYAIVRYSIVGGSGKDFFKIDPNTGIVYSTIRFDFEERNSYTLDVVAANPDSSMRDYATLTIRIVGENEYYPIFVQPVFHYDISESAAIGTIVGTVRATDQDAGDDGVVYYLFVGSSNDKGFLIDRITGSITISKRLDRETQNRVVLTVMAKNAGSIRGNDTDEAQVIISIQDGNDPPEFYKNSYDAEIAENTRIGTKVLAVKAFDKDVRQQHNQFSYSIIGGNTDKAFKIESQTGEIETASKLDRETTAIYNLIVAAIDTGTPPETGTATVRVTLTDVNDNSPTFDATALTGYVTENDPPGTVVMTLNAKDADLPPNGAPFTYAKANNGGPYQHLFALDSQSGTITVAQSIDREQTAEIDFTISVEDNGDPRMKSTHTVKIRVRDQNDSPSFPRSVHVIVHAFDDLIPVGKIADVRPNDPDLVGDYKCRLLNDNIVPRGLFSIPSNCDLHASRIAAGSGFAFSVLGNDGKHSDVISTVTVEFLSFDNRTIDNGVAIRIENVTATIFLSRYYNEFIDTMKNVSRNGEIPVLYSVYDNDNGLELTVAIKDGNGYRNADSVRQSVAKRQRTLERLFRNPVVVGYSPCRAGVCENGGACKNERRALPETSIVDTQSLIFASPSVRHDFTCYCADGFAGQKCEKRTDPCTPNPCHAGGTCRRQGGADFQCQCPPQREGPLCEERRVDMCDENPCQNGGSCRHSADGSGYFCLCRAGYRGNQCELVADSCRPNPCANGGHCVSLKPGYKCNCPEGLHGRHCDKSTFGFGDLSFASFTPLDANTNDISVTFATVKSDSLLAYNYGAQTGGRSDFVALELVDGRAVFSYGGTRTAITSIAVPQNSANGAGAVVVSSSSSSSSWSLADGKWHKITATRNGRVVSLSVASCTENGDTCEECKPGDVSCYTDNTGPSGTLNFNNNPLYIGGLSSADAILERPGQVHSDDFVGCVHSVSINGRYLNLSSPIKSSGVEPYCNRSSHSLCNGAGGASGAQSRRLSSSSSDIDVGTDSVCGGGTCYDQWKRISCVCDDDSSTVAPNCNVALEPITISEGGGSIEFKISEKHRRSQLLEYMYGGSTLWHSRFGGDRSRRQLTATFSQTAAGFDKYVSFTFRTIKSNGLLLFAATDKDYTAVEMLNGQIVYRSRVGKSAPVNMSVDSNVILSDGQWHHLKLLIRQKVLRVYVDGEKVGEELDFESVHNIFDPYLTVLFLGGIRKEYSNVIEFNVSSFSGCLGNFSVNGEIQPFTGGGSLFPDVSRNGKVSVGCTGPVVTGAVSNPDPLRIGVSLVVGFFMTLLIAIVVSFTAFRIRKQKKEKPNVMPHLKQNGGQNMVQNGNVVTGAGDVIRSGLHVDATTVPPYMTDNGDIIRAVSGHHMVAPELISKSRYKDQDMITMEHMQRGQRPDIIEREVVGKSPPPREEHHPAMPQASHHSRNSSQMRNDHDLPEHYDLENSSSIAPSDIDIISHYNGYRDASGGNNIRKYKLTPPHLPHPAPPPMYHKHGVQHRHSPLHENSFTVHSRGSVHSVVRPSPVSRVESPKQLNLQHQSTPLARLSPSSEISQQMPRILTLQDISGKPLQSALLATTSSSGGVGKDVMHTNSERSLNSPVMSQLGSQSSSESRKTGDRRSHGHPRNSSLVSTLDVVSCTGARVNNVPMHHLQRNANCNDDNGSSTSSEESGNDSFTCSEIEYDNNSVTGEKLSDTILNNLGDENRNRNANVGVNGLQARNIKSNNNCLSPYNFVPSFQGSLSTLVASDDDDVAAHVSMFRPQQNGSPSSLGWEYLLNWGPNFENFAGVFKDIAELPETVNGRMNDSLRSQNAGNKSSEGCM